MSWLSALEERKRREEEEKQRNDAARKAWEDTREAAVRALYERYKSRVDSISEEARELVERAKQVGFGGVWSYGSVGTSFQNLDPQNSGLRVHIITMLQSQFSERSVSVYLEENGDLSVRYRSERRVKKGVYGDYCEDGKNRMTLEAVTPSVIESWLRWVATGEGARVRLRHNKSFRRYRLGGPANL